MNKAIEQSAVLGQLSDKQRACLDLALHRRMTSKQIARELGISKYAVDQRMSSARRALGTTDRDHTVVAYASLIGTYDRIIYDPVQLPNIELDQHHVGQAAASAAALHLQETVIPYGQTQAKLLQVPALEGMLIDRLSSSARVVIIALLSVAILALVLIGLSVSQTLSALISS